MLSLSVGSFVAASLTIFELFDGYFFKYTSNYVPRKCKFERKIYQFFQQYIGSMHAKITFSPNAIKSRAEKKMIFK